MENEIPSITKLAIGTTFTAVENKIPNVSDLVKKKKNYDAKIKDIKKSISPHLVMIS